jgi:hypothetical protein
MGPTSARFVHNCSEVLRPRCARHETSGPVSCETICSPSCRPKWTPQTHKKFHVDVYHPLLGAHSFSFLSSSVRASTGVALRTASRSIAAAYAASVTSIESILVHHFVMHHATISDASVRASSRERVLVKYLKRREILALFDPDLSLPEIANTCAIHQVLRANCKHQSTQCNCLEAYSSVTENLRTSVYISKQRIGDLATYPS